MWLNANSNQDDLSFDLLLFLLGILCDTDTDN